MRYNQLVITIIIILISTCAVFLSIRVTQISMELEEKELEHTSLLSQRQTLINNFRLKHLVENEILKDIYFMDISENRASLAEVMIFKRMLFFKYTEIDCHPCVDMQTEKLKMIGSIIGNEKIVLLTSYTKLRDLAAFIRINDIQFRVYNLNYKPLGLETDLYEGLPFLFLLNDNYQIESVHFPNSELPEFTDEFLNYILTKF